MVLIAGIVKAESNKKQHAAMVALVASNKYLLHRQVKLEVIKEALQ